MEYGLRPVRVVTSWLEYESVGVRVGLNTGWEQYEMTIIGTSWLEYELVGVRVGRSAIWSECELVGVRVCRSAGWDEFVGVQVGTSLLDFISISSVRCSEITKSRPQIMK